MKKKFVFIILTATLLFIIGFPFEEAMSADDKDVFSHVKLTEESLPSGVSIANELFASKQQLLKRRIKIGFPLNALLNQTIVYGTDQAKVNYLALPTEEWLEYGYSKLIKDDGSRSLTMTKNGIIVQVAATTKDFEEKIVYLLRPDLLQAYKIRIHRMPKGWSVAVERFMGDEELRQLEQKFGGQIKQAIAQEFIVGHEKITMKYYQCGTLEMAEPIARELAKTRTHLIKRLVELSGAVVVVADSQSSDLNELVMAFVNW